MNPKLAMYKDVVVGKGSALAEALLLKPAEVAAKEAKKVYNQTSENYAKLYSAEDRRWFAQHSKNLYPTTQIEETV